MSHPVYNFAAGPSVLPERVIDEVQQAVVEYADTRQSVLSLGHRSEAFVALKDRCVRLWRELLDVPDDYHVIGMQGGASLQFAMVALNLGLKHCKAQYINTGLWSNKAYQEASKLIETSLYSPTDIELIEGSYSVPNDVDYVHVTPNETAHGLAFDVPSNLKVPLVADMSSTILSQPIDVSRFGLIYACAQKNVGIPGLTMVIVHKDLVAPITSKLPSLLKYQTHIEAESVPNTVPTFAWFVTERMLQWVKDSGGVTHMAHQNQKKAERLYDCIDASSFYHNAVNPKLRSQMNVVFTLSQPELTDDFIKQAQESGLLNVKGHSTQGGIRVSLYNAMTIEGVEAMVKFMQSYSAHIGASHE